MPSYQPRLPPPARYATAGARPGTPPGGDGPRPGGGAVPTAATTAATTETSTAIAATRLRHMVISLSCRNRRGRGCDRRSPEGVVPPRLDGVTPSTARERPQPEGPNRSTLITPSGTPASRSRSVAASANAGEPQTNTSS